VNALTPVGSTRSPPLAALSRVGLRADALDLRALRYFAAAARTGNVGRAAQELGVTGSAISQQIRKLEDELGTALLVRHGRGVTPTRAGTTLQQRVDAVLRLLCAPVDDCDIMAETGGTVSLALPAELATVLAAPLLTATRRDWPNLTLDLREIADGSAEARLLAGEIDAAVLQDPSDLEDLHVERVVTESLGLVAGPRGVLADSVQPVRLRELVALPLILPGPRHWVRRLLAKAAYQHGARLEPAFQIDSLAIAKDMVRNGLGCAVLPAVAVRDETARGALSFRPVEQPALTVTHAVACRQAAPPLAQALAAAAARTVRMVAKGGDWPGARPARSALQPAIAELSAAAMAAAAAVACPQPARGALEFAEGD